MIRVYVPEPSKPERFTLLTPFQLIGFLAWMASIPLFASLLFPTGGF